MAGKDGVLTDPLEKCTMSRALSVESKPKFRSNQMEANLCIAGIVTRNIDQNDSNKGIYPYRSWFFLFFDYKKGKTTLFIFYITYINQYAKIF